MFGPKRTMDSFAKQNDIKVTQHLSTCYKHHYDNGTYSNWIRAQLYKIGRACVEDSKTLEHFAISPLPGFFVVNRNIKHFALNKAIVLKANILKAFCKAILLQMFPEQMLNIRLQMLIILQLLFPFDMFDFTHNGKTRITHCDNFGMNGVVPKHTLTRNKN
ncbi:hypothetical protein FF38_05287 [Lucilia cuprina]|uniref:Uncharacterized protein n=1 Tax=Lucilia cuprina TaxID=7375 RepID=A0A0L0CD14_LUCCU|nr:hypothetical protein FF38_05287 [Lucilia cuprina]